MNKDLMMKAAVQFKSVWPDQEETHLYKFHYGRFVTGMAGGTADVVCTREQFEDFVESLFEGAPDGATHCRPNSPAEWYKISKIEAEMEMYYSNCHNSWVVGSNGADWLSKNLIPRPAKKLFIGDTPQQLKEGVTPWVPEIGEECEFKNDRQDMLVDSCWVRAFFVGLSKDGHKIMETEATIEIVWLDESDGDVFIFRPLRTERELFIERATKDYLDQIDSVDVTQALLGRIFGAMYDAGYTKNNTDKGESQ